MNRLVYAAAGLLLTTAFTAPSLAQTPGQTVPNSCQAHSACDADSVCIKGECVSLVGKNVIVRVESASIAPKTRDGGTWDCDETPDPYVVVFFPNRTELYETKALDDTLSPQWQESIRITVPKSDRAIWFCLFDDDTFGSDDIRVGKEGATNCVGYKDVLDLVRLGQSKLETQGELVWIVVGAGLE